MDRCMTSILSSGYGRLHLAQSAEWLGKIGVKVKLICGWVPKKSDSWLVKICSKIIGRNLSSGLRKRIITLGNGGEVCSCAWVDFMCNALFILERKLFKGRYHDWTATFAWKVFGWQTRRFVKKLVKTEKNLVFHVRSGAGHGGAIILARKYGIPVIVDHSIAHPAYMEKHLRPEYEKQGVRFDLGISSPFWRMVAEDCELADVVLVNSHFVKKTFIEQGFPPEKVHVIYLGVRRDFVGLRKPLNGVVIKRPIRILFTGGFGFRKGAEYIFEALRHLSERTKYEFEMDVVGSYEGAAGLIEQYRAYDLPIKFHGSVPQDDLKQYLASADIYLFPSLAEGCASSGMEAMAAGLCVVATEESGLPIEDGKTGCIVPSKNAKAIAERILGLMENQAEINRMGQNAMELIRDKYSWELYADNVKKLYESLVSVV